MSDKTTALDQTEEESLTHRISDEVLEIAAGTGRENAAAFTLGACTGISVCPG